MKLMRHITTVCFCIILFLFMSMAVVTIGANCFRLIYVEDRWYKEYPLEENPVERYEKKISELKRRIDNSCTVSFPWSRCIDDVVSRYKNDIIGYNIDAVSSTYEAYKYVQAPCSNVATFGHELEKEGYEFLYIQTPSKDSVIYCQGREGEIGELIILERSRMFMDALGKTEVNVMDIALEPGLSLQYDKSNHWSPADCLLCASLIAKELNENYGFDFNIGDYDISGYIDLMDIYPEREKAIEKNCGYVFALPVPAKDTFYTITYAEEEVWEGNFQETLIKPTEEWNLSGDAYHNVYRMNNSLIYEIHNEESETNKGKKLLVIGDSFNWPVSSYLSVGIEDIVVIHNATFTGSLMTYIRQMEPDIILMIYNDAEFYDIYTEEAYCLE